MLDVLIASRRTGEFDGWLMLAQPEL